MDLESINPMIMTITNRVPFLEFILSQLFSVLLKVKNCNTCSEEENIRVTFRAQVEGIVMPFTRKPILEPRISMGTTGTE